MKKILLLTMLWTALSVSAQYKIGDLLKVMPDSLIPVLSKNNRLDMIDFLEAKMKAEVNNLLDGRSEMTALSDDSLSIKVSDALQVDFYLQDALEEYDSCRQVVCMVQTYRLATSSEMETCVSYYSVRWNPLSHPRVPAPIVPRSTVMQHDEKVAPAF